MAHANAKAQQKHQFAQHMGVRVRMRFAYIFTLCRRQDTICNRAAASCKFFIYAAIAMQYCSCYLLANAF